MTYRDSINKTKYHILLSPLCSMFNGKTLQCINLAKEEERCFRFGITLATIV